MRLQLEITLKLDGLGWAGLRGPTSLVRQLIGCRVAGVKGARGTRYGAEEGTRAAAGWLVINVQL